jgi:AAA+ superfamily predicted ATPase
MERSLGPSITWRNCRGKFLAEVMARLRSESSDAFAQAAIVALRRATLPFYREHSLLDARLSHVAGVDRAILLYGASGTHWLDGHSYEIHAVNEAETLALTGATVLDYLRFFLFALRGENGAFTLIERAEEIESAAGSEAEVAAARTSWRPLVLRERAAEGHYIVDATVAYDSGLFAATFNVQPDGQVEMIDDTPVFALDRLIVPTCPELVPEPSAAADSDAANVAPEGPVAPETALADVSADAAAAPAPPPAAAAPSLDDRAVTEAVVAVLLADAVTRSLNHRLLQRFNVHSAASGPVAQLARFVYTATPVIIIESEIPFVEEIVSLLLDPLDKVFPREVCHRAGAVSGDDTRCYVDLTNARLRLYALSFHAYRSLWDAEHVAHEFSLGTATVLIGCSRSNDVPEALRRVADLVLTLPRIDGQRFVEILKRVTGAPPPAGWDADGGEWVRYLLHSDFHAPVRLRFNAPESIDYLRERSLARLQRVSADNAPRLEDLHGLGEARQVAEDLIADIGAARTGQLPWSAVDRGFLLVGAPGTGKTTLARAIARACDIKFVQGSAAQWQSAGALDLHLRAIRETFAEARRYAPTILFIDEIDSIGNRDNFAGSNAIYQTEVVNALLEQVQGIDPDEPVVVIGATNHLQSVDPALRRAGRLDQVINIPRPGIAGLEQIFAFHLRPYRTAKQLAPDVDPRQLAELAFGLTGADVEFFVRGAARRARKERRSITQADLLAEVTRRPRRPDSVIQLSPEEMRRVAVHEAGHALVALLSPSAAAAVTFVTIIPRMDGSLGFTASVPAQSPVLTRPQVLERLRTTLGGRAAEELVYGREEISLNSGGGESSDLAVATRIATRVICTSGFGGDDTLQWTQSPTGSQMVEVDRLLRRTYRESLSLLRQHRGALDRLVEALVAEQEIPGNRARALIAQQARPVVRRKSAAGKRAARPRGPRTAARK